MRQAWRAGLAAGVAMAVQGCGGPGGTGRPEPPRVAPYGTWESPLGAERLAGAAVGVSDLQVADGRLYWRENRPQEGGRQLVVRLGDDGGAVPLTPDDVYVRSRVQEYGGASYVVVGDAIVFSHFADQRLYLQRGDAAPVALTPEGYQYADCVLDPVRPRLLCVREDHTEATVAANGEERNEIVAVPLPQGAAVPVEHAGQVLVTGTDFVAYPRPSPDGTQLAWIAWNHPDMPWDRAWLAVAPMTDEGLGTPATVAGGGSSAAIEPQWDADGTLYFLDDPDGWWNLFRWRGGDVAAVAPMPREFGGPLWQLGASTYALTGDGRAVVRSSLEAVDTLGVLDLESGALRRFELPFVAFGDIRLRDPGTAVTVATAADDASAVIEVDLATGVQRQLYRASETPLPAGFVSRGQPIVFPTAPDADGRPRTAHAFFYPPLNPGFQAPAGELPPLLVMIHGGPTSVARPVLALAKQYWTTRGFAVVDVNYGGSTTFGRAYRERLNGQWGVVDVQDAVAAVDHLVATGRVDPERLVIRGGSAGGYTTLAALAFTDRFRAGANYYGVSDIAALAATSHKFERNYDVSLVGPPNEALYRARSPLYHLEGFGEPLITLQGSEDRIVPPEQSRAIVDAVRARGVPVAYLEFEGEQHGFRRAENVVRATEAELYFYGRVFGFRPAGEIEPVAIDNLPPAP